MTTVNTAALTVVPPVVCTVRLPVVASCGTRIVSWVRVAFTTCAWVVPPPACAERAADLYDTASTKAGEVVTKTRDAVTNQAGSISAAVEAGKKAYVEEKRKTELSGRTDASPTYKPETTM